MLDIPGNTVIALDVHGTLISRREVDDLRVVQVFRQMISTAARKAGAKVVMVSAGPTRELQRVASLLDLGDQPAVAELGHVIMPTVLQSPSQLLASITADMHLAVALIWVLGATAIVGFPARSVRLIHWANGHMMENRLLPAFAARFNAAGYRTPSGAVVEVATTLADSGEIIGKLQTLILHGSPAPAEPNPVLVTPAADHWMENLSFLVGRPVWRRELIQPIATTYLGIVTTRDMAQCLGWPQREIGFEDVIRLAAQPHGWRADPCAKPEPFIKSDPRRGHFVLVLLVLIHPQP